MVDHISIANPLQGSPSRISWGSVFAGVVVATAVMFTLGVLGMAFGFGLLKPLDPSKDSSVPVVAVAGVIAWTLSAVIATFAGGLAAAHLARQRNETDTLLHGLLVWGIGVVAMITLGATAAGVLVGGAFSLVGAGMHAAGSAIGGAAHGAGAAMDGAMSAAGSAINGAAPSNGGAMAGFNWDAIKFKAESLLKEGGGKAGAASAEGGADARRQPQSNAAAKGASANATSATDEGHAAGSPATGAPGPTNDDAMSLIGRLFSNPTATVTESDRSAVVSLLTARAAMTNDEATQMVHQWEQAAQKARDQYQAFKAEAEQKARTAAAASAKALADAAWIDFVASVLAASAAALGAHLGGPRLTTDERRVAAARVVVVNPV